MVDEIDFYVRAPKVNGLSALFEKFI